MEIFSNPGFRRSISEVLSKIDDPELGADIVSLGLVYGIEVMAGRVLLTMTLTYPGCPLSEFFRQRVTDVIRSTVDVEEVEVRFTFSPAWQPGMMDPDLRAAYALGDR